MCSIMILTLNLMYSIKAYKKLIRNTLLNFKICRNYVYEFEPDDKKVIILNPLEKEDDFLII